MSTKNFNTAYNNNYQLYTKYFNYYYTLYYRHLINNYQYNNVHNIYNNIAHSAPTSNINQQKRSKHIKQRIKRKKATKLMHELTLINKLHSKPFSTVKHPKCKPTTTNKQRNHLPTIISTNTRSICNKTDLANQLIDDANPDIGFFNETWIKDANKNLILNQLNPINYNIASSERQTSRGGGTLIMIRKNYAPNIKQLPIHFGRTPTDTDIENDQLGDIEATAVKIKPDRLPRGYSSIIAVSVYIPEWSPRRQTSAIYQLIEALEPLINNNTNSDPPIIFISGDLNGTNISPLLRSFNLYQLKCGATRGKKEYDLIITNAPKCYKSTLLPSIGKSDHKVIYALPDQNAYKANLPKATKIKIRTGRITDTVASICNTNWHEIIPRTINSANCQTAMDSLYCHINAALDTYQPLKTIKIKNDKPWMNKQIKELIEERQELFHSSLNTDSSANECKTKWKQVCNKIKRLVNTRKKAYYSKYERNNIDWWKEVKQSNTPITSSLINADNAAAINNAFYNVWGGEQQTNLAEFIVPSTDAPDIFNHNNVLNIISKMKKSAIGPDGIAVNLIKEAKIELADPLVHLFNNFLKFSFVPDQWKNAHITPIPKISIPSSPLDYRPISVLSVMGKIMERVIAKYIINYTKNLWINNEQYGFLPGFGTVDAIIQVIDDWSLAKDNKKEIIAIFFDFAKAFDLVKHHILLKKLQKYLPEWLISWLAAYLTNRYQMVVTNNITTEWKKVEAGVIQGSVLGPILFLLFILDINEYIPKEANLKKYADDILAYIIGDKVHSNLPQEIADGISKWCEINQMRLNINKCKVMIMNNVKQVTKPAIIIENQTLEIVPIYKYLGMFFVVNN